MPQMQASNAVRSVLAIIGFIAVVGGGIYLAFAATRFVPGIVNGMGSAAVYLGSFFRPAPPSSLSVVPTPVATSTKQVATTTEPVATSTPKTPEPTPIKPVPGPETKVTYPISGATTTPPTLSGLPDLETVITRVGYLATSSTDSFVATTTVPAGYRPAVKFSIKNVGTNVVGAWRFTAVIPTESHFIYTSDYQQPLAPGESIDYVLGFDQPIRGFGQTITVNTNPDRSVQESTLSNNSASVTLTILGS